MLLHAAEQSLDTVQPTVNKLVQERTNLYFIRSAAIATRVSVCAAGCAQHGYSTGPCSSDGKWRYQRLPRPCSSHPLSLRYSKPISARSSADQQHSHPRDQRFLRQRFESGPGHKRCQRVHEHRRLSPGIARLNTQPPRDPQCRGRRHANTFISRCRRVLHGGCSATPSPAPRNSSAV